MADDLSPRVGYIGTGWTDRVQIPAFTLGGLTPQAISSRTPEKSRRVAEKYSIPDVHDRWEDLITSPNVDIVSICTPPDTHREMAVAALQAGKHVICEKPMALNVAEAEAMFAAAQAAPGQLAIIDHELRFHPMRMQLRHMLKENAIGGVMRIELTRLGSERLNASAPYTWWSDEAAGGGILGAVGSHLLDLGRWLIGRMDGLAAQLQIGHHFREDADGHRQQVTADDHADVLIRFSGGVSGRITASGLTPGGYGLTTLITGTDGALRLDHDDTLWIQQGSNFLGGDWEVVRPRFAGEDLSALPSPGPFSVGSYYLAQTLATALPMGDVALPDAASFYDGLVVQRALDAIRRSHREEIWVAL
jgi:predicted dehydrogenase